MLIVIEHNRGVCQTSDCVKNIGLNVYLQFLSCREFAKCLNRARFFTLTCPIFRGFLKLNECFQLFITQGSYNIIKYRYVLIVRDN